MIPFYSHRFCFNLLLFFRLYLSLPVSPILLCHATISKGLLFWKLSKSSVIMNASWVGHLVYGLHRHLCSSDRYLWGWAVVRVGHLCVSYRTEWNWIRKWKLRLGKTHLRIRLGRNSYLACWNDRSMYWYRSFGGISILLLQRERNWSWWKLNL